jgi:membrane-associated protein
MPARTFLVWNIIGAILWTDGILLVGYLLAKRIAVIVGDKIDRYLLPVVILIVLISILPIVIEMVRERRSKRVSALGVVAASTVAGIVESTTEAVRKDSDGDQRPRSHRRS